MMANNKFPYTAELKDFQDAEDAWSAELTRVFGKQACNARYDARGKGLPNTDLQRLHDARQAAMAAWHNSAY
jgi:hypothetical protein